MMVLQCHVGIELSPNLNAHLGNDLGSGCST